MNIIVPTGREAAAIGLLPDGALQADQLPLVAMATLMLIKGNREFVKWWNYWMERVQANRDIQRGVSIPREAQRRADELKTSGQLRDPSPGLCSDETS